MAHHILPKLHRWTVAEDHLENEADGYKVAGTEGVEASRRVAAFAAIPPGSSAIIVNGRVSPPSLISLIELYQKAQTHSLPSTGYQWLP